MADGWAYYDASDERAHPRSKRAAFRGHEVPVASGNPAPPNHASMGLTEYRDVHAIDRPEIRKDFKSFSLFKAWLKQRSATAA